MEGASIRGGRGTLGLQTRLFALQAERWSWREGCLRAGALTARTSAKVRISSQRDSEAAGWDTRRSYMSMNRAVGAEGHAGDGGDPFAEGHAPAGNGKWGGFEYNCSCVLSGKHSCMTTPPRSRCVPRSPGLLASFPAQSRQREANESDSSTAERSARAATRWVHGARSADPDAAWRRSVRPTPCGGPPSVRSATFPGGETERQRSVASGKWPCSRLFPMSWPGEASRPTTVSSATGGASRRIAVSCPCEASRAIAGPLVGRSLATIGVLLFRGRTTF
jgi:hypothetical protein